ncbi:MAG: HigA family addiction module antitoxin [Bdellovibrionia bacterium]
MLPKNRAPAHPGEILERLFLKELGVSQSQLAEHLKCKPGKINEIINGKRGITPQTALDLADTFGNSPQFWLNLQQNYELWQAAKDHKPLRKLKLA